VNNLKQIGLALHNYHSTNDNFPMGVSRSVDSPTTATTLSSWAGWSAQALLLASMEQSAVFNACNFSFNPNSTSGNYNSTALNTVISSFLCPSDPNSGTDRINNYHASLGTTTTSNPTTPTGPFGFYNSYGLRHITDGSSNTVAFAESLVGLANLQNRYRGNMAHSVGDTSPTSQLLDATMDPNAITAGIQKCATAFRTNATNTQTQRGYRWGNGRTDYTLCNTVATPNDRLFASGGCRYASYTGTDSSNFVPATSAHPGGVNVLFCDGSVKFIKDSINRLTWWALGTRANGEVISSDAY